MGLYDFSKRIASAEQRVLDADYSQKNKDTIFSFVHVLYAEGLSEARILKYLSNLNILASWFDKDFDEVTKSDMYRVVAEIERSDRKAWTKQGYKVTIKRFFRWLHNSETDPEITRWIKTNIKQCDQILPEELLTEDEVKQMIDVCDHPRNRAMVAMWYDAGGRVGEMGEAKIKHFVPDVYGAVLMVKGKTGMRRIRLVFSAPYVSKWLDTHPERDNPDAPLWVNYGKYKGRAMKYGGIRMVIKRAANKAGIKKRVYNHLFRHSRITEYATFMTQAQLEKNMGWVHGTRQSGTYIHLAGAQVDSTILEHYGLKEKQDKPSELTPKNCPRCKTTNGPTADFCSNCGMALNAVAATNVDDMQQLGMQLLLEIGAKEPKDVQELQGYLGKLKEALNDSDSTSISDK
ncbi:MULTISPECIES: tyrosine-type recombinase/integrase [Methanosarcinaceae]|uniref:Site-specific recombinase XerD n=1 Tax=Methanolobus profundi TaxID=487685 RepID=A0A1I4UGF6_9EURY|nr:MULTISPECIES: tyrosine-type recombinase/integrase [Methanosarcinaceae]MBP2030380.1 site-specific recombinase XerD [Methanohalophilus levihalophilus]SFM88048.1 Site-specific recombinase XerD [Methanolobus profundi]